MPEEAVKLIYTYWSEKRKASNRPLLQRLWFEQPWVRRAAKGSKQGAPHAGDNSDGDEDDSASDNDSEGVPFMGRDTPRSIPHGGRLRHMQASDVRDALRGMRCVRTADKPQCPVAEADLHLLRIIRFIQCDQFANQAQISHAALLSVCAELRSGLRRVVPDFGLPSSG